MPMIEIELPIDIGPDTIGKRVPPEIVAAFGTLQHAEILTRAQIDELLIASLSRHERRAR